MARISCPAVLVLRYCRGGQWHQLMLTICNGGEFAVGLRIGRSWSGWHGAWKKEEDGSIIVQVHYKGDDYKLVKIKLLPVSSSLMVFWQRKENLFVEILGIRTKLISQRQLGDLFFL